VLYGPILPPILQVLLGHLQSFTVTQIQCLILFSVHSLSSCGLSQWRRLEAIGGVEGYGFPISVLASHFNFTVKLICKRNERKKILALFGNRLSGTKMLVQLLGL